MKIGFVSDFKIRTGYYTLGVLLASELVRLGHEVVVLGLGYDEAVEHYFEFSLNPTKTEFAPQQIIKMDEVYHFDWVLFMMDVPKQVSLYRNIEKNKPGWLDKNKVVSLFPVESAPFYKGWGHALRQFTKVRFTFSEFGKVECDKIGLPIHVLPYGPSSFWYEPVETEIISHPYILTVAANQNRKNLPMAMEMSLRLMRKRPDLDLVHVMITDIDSKDGWDLPEKAKMMGFEEGSFVLMSRDIVPNETLRALYSKASVFLLTSVSEGIGLPIYEAQAQGCPAVATNCCAIPEAVRHGDHLIKVAHETSQAWGNSTNYWPSIKDGVDKLEKVIDASVRVKVTYPEPESMARKMMSIFETIDAVLKVRNVAKEK